MAEKLQAKVEIKTESSDGEKLEGGIAETENSLNGAENSDSNDDLSIDEILKMKVALSDGTESLIFSRGPKYSDTVWPFNCHLCRSGLFVMDAHVISHVKSKNHKQKLAKAPLNRESFMKPFWQLTPKNSQLNKPIRILPGEMITEITPDLEDRLIKADDFEFRSVTRPGELLSLAAEKIQDYNKRAPVMGLCYVLKMKKFGNRVYFCGLCNTEIHGEAYQHFVGANHQAQYVVKHFPKLYEKVVKGLKDVDKALQQKYVRNIFRKIYRKIEMAKGFREITVVDYINFKRYRPSYRHKLREGVDHYDENTIKISEEEVQKFIGKSIKGFQIINPDLISLDKPKDGVRDDLRGLQAAQRKQPKPSRKRGARSSSPNMRREGEQLKKSRREEGKKARFVDDPQDWQRYRKMVGKVLDDLDKIYEDYEDEPESHPEYDVEWRMYWRRRSQELERDGIDPRYYDFNKEWIPFWMRRLQEFHAKDIVKRKFEIKRTLRLSYDARSPSPIRERRRPRRRSPTPPPAYNSARYSDRQRSNVREDAVAAPTEPLSVISVMRLLSALEDQLGSLGPKAVQLLSRAVLFEKNNQNTNELLLENEVYVFFMTAKEKLKGQLLANIVEPSKIRAANRAVEDLVTILSRFEEHLKRQQSTNPRGNYGNSNSNQNLNRNGQNQQGRDNQYGFGNGNTNISSNLGTGNQSGSTWQSGALTAGQNNYRGNDGNYQSFADIKAMNTGNNSNYQSTLYNNDNSRGKNFNVDLQRFFNAALQNSNGGQNQMGFRNANSRPMGHGNSNQQNVQPFNRSNMNTNRY